MFGSDAFDYINVLTKAADASWLRKDVISNNIANVDTPGYKRQDVKFDDILQQELKYHSTQPLNKRVAEASLDALEGKVYTDSAGYSYRLDGNNVDIDTENVELAAEQIKYNGLIDSLSHEFSGIKAVCK